MKKTERDQANFQGRIAKVDSTEPYQNKLGGGGINKLGGWGVVCKFQRLTKIKNRLFMKII